MKRGIRWSIGAFIAAVAIGTTTFSTDQSAFAAIDGPVTGTRYSVEESGVELDVYPIPTSSERQVLVSLRIECDSFAPRARVVVPVRRGTFRVRGTFSDPDTTDIVDAVIELTGRFGAGDSARVDVAVDLEAYDNDGATGSCDREVEGLDLAGETDAALEAMGPTVALEGRRTPTLASDRDHLFIANPTGRRTTLLVVDPDGEPARRARFDGQADALAVLNGTVWALDSGAGSLAQLDPVRGGSPSSVRIGAPVDDTPPGDPGRALDAVVVSDQSLWTATATEVLRIDPSSASVTARIAIDGSRVLDLAGSDDGVYAVVEDRGADGLTGRILRIDPETDAIAAEVAVPSPFVGPLAVGPDALWTGRPLERRDLASLAILATGAADEVIATGLIAEPPGVWIAGIDGLAVLDSDLEPVFGLPGIHGSALVALGDVVWIADAGLGRLFRFEVGIAARAAQPGA